MRARLFEIAVAWVEGLALTVTQVTGRNDPERANGGERARLGTAQGDVVVTHTHAFALRTSRKLEILHEHVAGIERGTLARIRHPAATALAQLSSVPIIPRIVERTRIEVTHGNFPLTCVERP